MRYNVLVHRFHPGAETALLAVLLMLLGTGCRTTRFEAAKSGASPPVTVSGLLEAGDELDIQFYYASELDSIQTIRPDGQISLKLVGELRAAGLSPSGLEKLLEERYKGLVDRPEVTVVVRRLNPQVVFVGGAVTRPRAVALTPRMTVLGALIEAGDIDPVEAKVDEVVVLRQMADGQYNGYAVNVSRVLNGKDRNAFYLQPGDIVSVPRKRVADMNRWIEQYINRMVPFGFFASKQSGTATYGIDTSGR